jgi:hypothetical protein
LIVRELRGGGRGEGVDVRIWCRSIAAQCNTLKWRSSDIFPTKHLPHLQAISKSSPRQDSDLSRQQWVMHEVFLLPCGNSSVEFHPNECFTPLNGFLMSICPLSFLILSHIPKNTWRPAAAVLKLMTTLSIHAFRHSYLPRCHFSVCIFLIIQLCDRELG